MEHLAPAQWKTLNVLLQDSSVTSASKGEVIARVRVAVGRLHAKGWVHGDLHANNILISADLSAVKLVDLDWMGRSGVDTYPCSVNILLMWHAGVGRGKLLDTTHDTALLDDITRILPSMSSVSATKSIKSVP
jgi:serine/threonine protein kinase